MEYPWEIKLCEMINALTWRTNSGNMWFNWFGGKLSKTIILFIHSISELPDATAKLIVCVAYNAIRLTDIPRSQLYSSAKALNIKNAPKEKNELVRSVAQALLHQRYVKVLGNLKNSSRDNIKKLKPFWHFWRRGSFYKTKVECICFF